MVEEVYVHQITHCSNPSCHNLVKVDPQKRVPTFCSVSCSRRYHANEDSPPIEVIPMPGLAEVVQLTFPFGT